MGHFFKMHSYNTIKNVLYLWFESTNYKAASPQFSADARRSKQRVANRLDVFSCRSTAKRPSTLLCEMCFRLTKAKKKKKTFGNFSKVQIHGRRHVQPPLFVPVKCVLALINWHYYIPLPHLSLLPLYSPTPFHAPSHTFLSLPALTEC